MAENVAIIGASHKPQRYAYQAQELLMGHQHTVFPISGNGREILGVPGYRSISDIEQAIDTVTLYLNPQRHQPIIEDLLNAGPRRIIFNPGTESDELIQGYRDAGIETLEACTLVMLRTGQF
jgi:predicted CoA-binding protein